MKHLERNRCGWENYTCIGIPDLLSDSISMCCDTVNYDKSDRSRPNDFNYYNLPTSFQGVVNLVPFINLQSLGGASYCISSYDIMDASGFQDAWASVGNVSDYKKTYGDFNSKMACYLDGTWEVPGIMSPKAMLSAFNTAPSIVVPTSQLRVDPDKVNTGAFGTSSWSGQSACVNGFLIIPMDRRSSGFILYVSAGQVITGVDSSGKVQITKVPATYPQGSGTRYTVDIQVYLMAKYNFASSKWVCQIKVVQFQQDWDQEVDRQQWEKVVLLGTVNCVAQGHAPVETYVSQTVCSPVDIRDYVSQVALPTGSGTGLYVFTYQGSSKVKKWVQVKDC